MTDQDPPPSTTPNPNPTVGFVGLGTMGASMATNLINAGHELVVHDLRRLAADPHMAIGATWAATPAEVAASSDVVFTSLPGPRQVEQVVLGDDGLIASARPDLAWFDLTTSSPTLIRHLHDVLTPLGVDVFDAPVSGGREGAESGQMAIWVGGDPGVLAHWLPVLGAFSDAVRHVGPIGAGSVAKLVHNLTGYIVQAALAETFTLGVKAGVEPGALWEAVRQGAIGRRRTFDSLGRHLLPGRFDPPDFALDLARKDVGLACDLGRELDVPMRLANLALDELLEALGRGWGGRDSRVAMVLQEERAGVEIRLDPVEIRAILDRDQTEPPPIR